MHPFPHGRSYQGSRTALPICGYFLQSVLNDPNFKHYRAKFDIPNDPDIERGMYICDSYYEHKKDTFDVDSLDFEDYMIEIDDNGNPIAPTAQPASEPTQPNEQQIMLEDL